MAGVLPVRRDEHRLDDDLKAAGFGIDDIDYVFQTHLHLDHAGGLEFFDGTDVPVLVHERAIEFAYRSAKTDEGSTAYVLEDFDHDLNWELLHEDRERHFEEEIPLGAGLLWGKRPWFESLQRIEDLQRRHDAEVVYGHDPEQFETIREGWGA